MKILVAIKHAIHYPHKINPYDIVAIEEALRLRDAAIATDVVVVSVGGDECYGILRTALAMGADRAVFVKTQVTDFQPLTIAKTLQAIVKKEMPSLAILGRQFVSTEYGQTGQMLAGLLHWPQATFVVKIEIERESSLLPIFQLKVWRETDNGLQALLLQLPAVIMVELSLNEPRHITIPHIVKAKNKPLEVILLTDLAIDIRPRLFVQKLTPAPKRRVGIRVKDVEELLHKLRFESKVL